MLGYPLGGQSAAKPEREGSTTIPKGSRDKCLEAVGIYKFKAEGNIMPAKITNRSWIFKVNQKYPHKFTFEKTKYNGLDKPVIVTCKIHGDIEMARARNILYAKNYPCAYCTGKVPEFDGTQAFLWKWFHYYPDTGLMINRATVEPIGSLQQDGYIRFTIDGKEYPMHRIIYKFMLNKYPEVIDHKDRNKSNNKWDNLRPATVAMNAFNKGAKGYTARGNKFEASIKYNGKQQSLGLFDTEEEAKTEYLKFQTYYMSLEADKVVWVDDDIV